jgi:hypothetical protein
MQLEASMIALCSLVSLVLGATIAVGAERYPGHAAAMETVAGVLLVGGLGLIGAGLPVFI